MNGDWGWHKTMSERIKISDLPKFDAADHLDSEETIAAYLADISEANDPALLASALEDVARARARNAVGSSRSVSGV